MALWTGRRELSSRRINLNDGGGGGEIRVRGSVKLGQPEGRGDAGTVPLSVELAVLVVALEAAHRNADLPATEAAISPPLLQP